MMFRDDGGAAGGTLEARLPGRRCWRNRWRRTWVSRWIECAGCEWVLLFHIIEVREIFVFRYERAGPEGS